VTNQIEDEEEFVHEIDDQELLFDLYYDKDQIKKVHKE
jgi:hypothetical protein